MRSLGPLFRAEMGKLLRLRLTWVLLGLLIVILALRVDNIYGHAFDPSPDQENVLAESLTVLPRDYHRAAVLPGVFERARLSFDWINLSMILLAAVTVGQEFVWGTMRTALARGPGRVRLLLAKFAALAVMAAFYLLALWLVSGLLGLLTTPGLEGSIDWGFWSLPFLRDEMAALARTWAVICPIVALALWITVWVRNPGLALSLLGLTYVFEYLVYMFSGGALGAIVSRLMELGQTPAERNLGLVGTLVTLVPHYNGALVVHWARPGKLSEFDRGAILMAEALNLPHDPWRGLAVLWSFGAVALLLAGINFWRRDVVL